jgi:phosphoribosylanthranilate isomerase
MTPEDEEFNRIERESHIRKQAVLQALHNENERLGLYKSASREQLIAEVAVLTEMVRVLSVKQEQGEPVIAGALFDFMGWLTSRKERLVLSSADEASPAVDAIRDFAKMRGLSLDDARVQDWNTTPPQRTWVGLTPEEVKEISLANRPYVVDMVVALEARLKQKNGYAEENT